MNPLWFGLPIVVVALLVEGVRHARGQRLVRLRAAWGAPVERVRRIEAMSASHHARRAVLSGGGSLDERTWTDLDFDAVFAVIDRSESTLGQHALYHRLRTAPVSDHPSAFETLVRRMTNDATTRERAQTALSRLQDPHGYDVWWLASPGAVEPRPWYPVFPVLTATAVALAIVAPFWPSMLTPFIAVLLLNVAVHYVTDVQIGNIARSFRQCAPLIATAESLAFLADDADDPLIGSLLTDVPRLARLKSISRWVNGDPFMLAITAGPLTTIVSHFVAAIYEYLNLGLLLDATGVYFATGDLARHGRSLARVAAAAGEVDAAISVASFRAGRKDWTMPECLAPGSTTELTDLRHPLVPAAVPNSIAIRPGRGVLVTGSNMSGKSTFLRTVGVNAVLAQTIGTCLARTYRAPVFGVRSCIGRSDDLVAGKSYYLVEVESLLELVRASEDRAPHLFLLDELFRGTNAVERIAAGQAVLQQLLAANRSTSPHIVLAATHDQELVDLTSDLYEACHFGDSIGPDGLTFDHRLQHGPATTRNAIALLRLHGAPDGLLTQATTTAEMLDRQRGTSLLAR